MPVACAVPFVLINLNLFRSHGQGRATLSAVLHAISTNFPALTLPVANFDRYTKHVIAPDIFEPM